MRQPLLFESDQVFDYKIDDGVIMGSLGDAPVILSCGVGTDSVAMLVRMHREGVAPSAIVTALVGRGEYGNEHPRFYAYLHLLEEWLESVSFPPITYVWYQLKRKAKHYHYESLAGNCIANRTLPSLAFRRNHSCSLKWKGTEIDRWVTGEYGSRPCYRLIGYDCTEGYRNSRFKVAHQSDGPRSNDLFIYPLQYWQMTRDDCERIIIDEGLPLPGKSSCIFCPSMKAHELHQLPPVSLWMIVIIEAHASVKLTTINGLWGHNESMTSYIVNERLLPSDTVAEVWQKWSAIDRPSELADNPDAVADEVLFSEARRLAANCLLTG